MRLESIKKIDWIIVVLALLLISLGLLVLYSSGIKSAEVTSQLDTSRQFFYVGVGLALMFFFARLDYRVLKNYAFLLYAMALAGLVWVDLAGRTSFGAQRWISIGFFQFQPSEFAKLIFIIVLAKFYSRHYERMSKFRYLAYSLVYLALPLGLVLAQPDLGTGIVFIAIWAVMTLASGVRKLHFFGLAALGLASLPLVMSRLQTYQRNRIMTFLNPAADPLGSGYNVSQAMIAVGSGGLFGKGLSAGSQSQLNFLPSQHTDFIFAVLAEKLGFVGGAVMLGLYLALILRATLVATKASDNFGAFLVIGISTMLIFQMLVNVGMNMGIMPVTGIPLPFISAGGSSILISMISIGIVLSVSSRKISVHVKQDDHFKS